MSTKGCSEFILLCLDLDIFAKIEKRPGFYTLTESIFINSSSKQIKKNSEHPFVGIVK